MAQFRTTADLVDKVLQNGGEVTSGSSSYESQVLEWLNRVHMAIVAGGTISLGRDTTVEIDEVWPWARSARPLLLELQPKYETGTITLTQGSEAGTFSSGPASSLAGWYLQVTGREEWLRIASHTAGATAFELDGAYPDDSGSGLNYTAVKFDYDLIPDYIVIDSSNNKMQFQKVSGTTLTATLTAGTYTPSDLISHVATQMTTAAGGPTITGSYSATTRKFTLTSDLAGATSFYIVGNGDQSDFSAHKILGYDDETSSASAASHTSTYVLGGLARIVEPMKIHKGSSLEGNVYGIDPESFQRDYPFTRVTEGFPDRFSIIREKSDGTLTVRFNRYPKEKTRIEVEKIDVPHDLKDNSASIPLLPRKHVDVLEDAATFYLMVLKSDDRASVYANLAQGKLKAMVSQHRGAQVRSGKNFGQIVSRPDLIDTGRKRLNYGYE